MPHRSPLGPAVGPKPGLSTGERLGRWLASRVSLRASTARSYAAHPGLPGSYLGGIPLAALTAGDVQAMFIAIIRDEAALGRPVSAATLHRIHATLCAALNGAVRAGLNELFFECFQQSSPAACRRVACYPGGSWSCDACPFVSPRTKGPV